MTSDFVVVFERTDLDVESIVEEHWPSDQYRIVAKNVVALRLKENLTSDEVAQRIGMNPEQQLPGIVFPIRGFYQGWHSPRLWEWLSNGK